MPGKPALWIGLILALVLVVALYRSRTSSSRLDVEPNAAREIDKAKQR